MGGDVIGMGIHCLKSPLTFIEFLFRIHGGEHSEQFSFTFKSRFGRTYHHCHCILLNEYLSQCGWEVLGEEDYWVSSCVTGLG